MPFALQYTWTQPGSGKSGRTVTNRLDLRLALPYTVKNIVLNFDVEFPDNSTTEQKAILLQRGK